MSKLHTALKLASLGFHIFPLKENSKLPLIKNYPNLATRDPSQIKAWWTCDISGNEKDRNIGISTSKWGDNGALVVIDVDNKSGKNGSENLLKLEIEGKELPDTFEQTTPTKGIHLVFRHSEAVKQGTNVLGNGLDIRSRGGYIVAAGSTLDELTYDADLQKEIAQVPEWVVVECGKATEQSEDKKKGKKYVATEYDIERAIYYLENEAPESIKGNAGDQTAYKVAARVKDFGISKEHCLELMLTHWFDGSGWSPEKLKLKIDHAYHYGKETVGANTPAAAFEKVESQEESEEHYLKIMNKNFALVYVSGTHSILHETIDEKGRATINLLSEATFKRMFSPMSLQKKLTYAEEWLDWKNRREYKGICFAPEREPRNGYYNTWQGFTTKPVAYKDASAEAKKGFDMLIEHAKENVCMGDEELFNWLMGYFAHLIQKPYERPLCTLVFQGEKGVGKNALVDRIGNLLGNRHYIVAHDGRYLTSNFNGHMESCLCMVLDEAFWSGDKSAEGKLKGLTTAPELVIERKGKESYTADNLVRVIVIGNEDWLVPASADERRFAVFAVGNGKKQQTEWFSEMRENIDDKGGNAVLLDYLKKFDLSTVNINVAPKTEALFEQKVNSLNPIEKFWFQCLNDGVVGTEINMPWPKVLTKKEMRDAFYEFCKNNQIKGWLPDGPTFGRAIKKLCPSMKTDKKVTISTERVSAYQIPLLDSARSDWEKKVGHKIDWETSSDNDILH